MLSAENDLTNASNRLLINKRCRTIECYSERLAVSKLRAAASNISSNDKLPSTLRPRKDHLHASVQSECELLEEETPTPAALSKHSDSVRNVPSSGSTAENAYKKCVHLQRVPLTMLWLTGV